MAFYPIKRRGVFCLEGDWWYNLKKPSSVQPILHLLSQWDPFFVPFIHRNVATGGSLEYYLDKWTKKKHADYPILYLAFHGDPGAIQLGDPRRRGNVITLDLLADLLEGKCKGRIIFFAACATLNTHGNRLNHFLRRTRALAVCGYRGDVDWLHATAFELLVFAAMQENAFTVAGARAMKKRILKEAGYLARDLKFRMIITKPKS
jgi:hypothetical protein